MKKKLIIFFTIAVLIFISLPLFNYNVDIARVFSKSYDLHYKEQLPNELFLQSQFLMEHPEYTKILFGSSRIGNGIDLTQYDGWYKAWHQGANLEEHLNTLKYVLKNGKKIDEVIIAIDYLSFFSKANKTDYFRQNPPLNWKDSIEFYNFYLFRKPTKKDFKHFFKRDLISKRKHIFSNEAQSFSREDEYFKNQSMFNPNRNIDLAIFYKNIEALKEIKTILEKNNIKISFFINPYHYKNYYGQDIDFISKYKQELVKIDTYKDCSLLIDNYTVDSKYWIDVSHYNKDLGNLILDDIFKNKNNICKEINKDNVLEINNASIKENFNKLIHLSPNDLKIIPNKNFFNRKILNYDINKFGNKYIFPDNLFIDFNSKKIFISLEITIEKPSRIEIIIGKNNFQQNFKVFDGFQKVTKDQTVGIILDSKDLKENFLEYKSNEKIKFKKIEIFELKDLE